MITTYLDYLTVVVSVPQSALIVCVTSYYLCLLTATAELNITSPDFQSIKKEDPTHKKHTNISQKHSLRGCIPLRTENDVTDGVSQRFG